MAYITLDTSDLLTDEHLEALNNANIWTINDLYSIDLMEVKRKTNIKYSTLKDLKDKIGQRYTLAKNPLGFLIDRQIKEECRLCPTGIPELTQALDGGFQTQEIVEFFGDTECGKTEMCHLICGEILSHFPEYQIFYIASNYDINYEKISKYTRLKAGNRELSDEEIIECLSRIEIARPNNTPDLVHLLNTLVHSDRRNKFKCIIIDSLSFIIQEDILNIKTDDVNNEKFRWDTIDTYLCELMKLLTTIAVTKNVIIVITNSDDYYGSHKSWTNGLSHRIHLTKMLTCFRGTIVKTIHNISKVGYTIPFAIMSSS